MKIRMFEMAHERNYVISKLKNYSETFGNHILKCAVFNDSTGSLKDWIKEIAHYMEFFDSLDVKKAIVLKQIDYQKYIFDEYATDLNDFKAHLLEFRLKERNYPRFDIDDGLILEFQKIFNDIKNSTCPILSQKENKSFNFYFSLIEQILKENGIEYENHWEQ